MRSLGSLFAMRLSAMTGCRCGGALKLRAMLHHRR